MTQDFGRAHLQHKGRSHKKKLWTSLQCSHGRVHYQFGGGKTEVNESTISMGMFVITQSSGNTDSVQGTKTETENSKKSEEWNVAIVAIQCAQHSSV
ncbi:hypothetical protein BaRGS_00021287 [Batillaria attramentaria]|uniref:Uncharacterized protein n=1 Tax=Batillaria attramentaria TaxID=370345 RepID=A0ABD0KKC2_9CAEN